MVAFVRSLALGSASFILTLFAAEALACGGAVTTSAGSVGVDAQRTVLSIIGGNTEIIAQLNVPDATTEYGVLLPVAGTPTLDPNPVDSDEITDLDFETRPILYHDDGGGGGGGCGCAASGSGGTGLNVSEPVTIGPVEAQVVSANDGTALFNWLASNGFLIPAGFQPVVDSYVGPGRSFVVFKRSDGAPSGPSSVGVHITASGHQLTYPLVMSRLGSAAELAVTVFVFSDQAVAPTTPYTALTLNDLDAATINHDGYASAVRGVVAAHNDQAFVLEGVWSQQDVALFPSLDAITEPGQTLTRMSAIFDPTNVVADPSFTATAPADVPNELRLRPATRQATVSIVVALLLLALAALRRFFKRD